VSDTIADEIPEVRNALGLFLQTLTATVLTSMKWRIYEAFNSPGAKAVSKCPAVMRIVGGRLRFHYRALWLDDMFRNLCPRYSENAGMVFPGTVGSPVATVNGIDVSAQQHFSIQDPDNETLSCMYCYLPRWTFQICLPKVANGK
jgi:hypothetical protein